VAAAFALTVPGLGALCRREAIALGVRAGPSFSSDRRADLVLLPRVARLRTAEDVFVDLGRFDGAVSTRAVEAVIGGRRGGVRVVVRVADERRFRRTELRDRVVRQLRPLTRVGDDRSPELWIVPCGRSLRVGVRIASLSRRGSARSVERPGALRPSVAAAMVLLADAVGPVLDPTCGTGTIVLESPTGSVGADLDPVAVDAALGNGCRSVLRADARALPFGDATFGAVVANLPFGHRHATQGLPVAWYRRVLAEAMRVAPTTVVLAPPSAPFRQALGRLHVSLDERHDIRLLGMPTTIWRISSDGLRS
jgi:hypothetical protein